MILTVAVAAYPLWEPNPARRILLLVALTAVVTLMIAVLARWPLGVGWGLVGLLVEYGFSLLGRDALDVGAPLYAVSLLVLGELIADLAGVRPPRGPGRQQAEIARVLMVAVVAGVVASIVLAAASLLGESGAAVQLVGVVAAGGALVLLILLANERMPLRGPRRLEDRDRDHRMTLGS